MRIIGNDPSTPRQAQIVASGTLSTGDAVIVNSDGTVSVVEGVAGGSGTAVVFENEVVTSVASTYDANSQKVVVAYRDNSFNYGTAVVGTVSGTSISFGTPVVFESANTGYVKTVYDANAQKIVITYQDQSNSSYGTAIVGTVSGTSISFGSAVVFESATSGPISSVYDASTQKIVVAYRDYGNSYYGTAIVGTVSGTSISFGSPAVFETANVLDLGISSDGSGTILISYQDGGNSSYGTAVAGTVSGTSISFGTPVVHTSESASSNSVVYDSNADKFVLAFKDGSNSNGCVALVATVSGTSVSLGSKVILDSPTSNFISAVFDANSGKVAVAYTSTSNSYYGTFRIGTVSGTSISFEDPTVFAATNTGDISVAVNPSGVLVFSYHDAGNSYYGTSVAYQPTSTNLTANNYIGTAATGAPDTQRAKINLKGAVDENQSGLTAGQSYYVQVDGTLGTTPADPSVFAGTAVAANKLIVKG